MSKKLMNLNTQNHWSKKQFESLNENSALNDNESIDNN